MCTKPSEPLNIKRIQGTNLARLTNSNLSFTKYHVVLLKYRYRPSYSPVQRSLIQKSVMPTSREGISKDTRSQWLCNVVLCLMIFLFDSHQMARLPLMNLVRITDKNKRTNCAQNNNRCNFKYLTVFCVTVFCVTVFCVTVFCVTVFCVTVFCVTVFCVTVFCVTVFCVSVRNLAKQTQPRILEKKYIFWNFVICVFMAIQSHKKTSLFRQHTLSIM